MGGPGPEGIMIAPALNGRGHAWHHSTEGLFNDIKRRSDKNNSTMPAYEKVLSDEEIHHIIDYFQSLWPEKLKQRHPGH
jgi:mono/diheme cytochrome c family protein